MIPKKLLFVFTLVIFTYCNLKWVVLSSQSVEIDTHDETRFYLFKSKEFIRHGFPSLAPDYGGLYSLWYAFLSLWETDPIRLHDLSKNLILVLVPLLYLLFLLRMKISFPTALFAAHLLVLNPLFLVINRRVNHFALLCLLAGIVLASLSKRRSLFWAMVTWAFALASYIRPEYFISFVLCLGYTIFPHLRRLRFLDRIRRTKLLIFVSSFLLLPLVMNGLPVGNFNSSSGKSTSTFLMKNLERRSGQNQIADLYQDPQNIFQAMKNNPREFTAHLMFNSRVYLGTLKDFFYGHAYLAGMTFFQRACWIFIIIILGHWILSKFPTGLYIRFSQKLHLLNKGGPGPFSPLAKEFFPLNILACLPVVVSSLLYGPLNQYTLGQYPFLLILVILMAGKVIKWNWFRLKIGIMRTLPFILLTCLAFSIPGGVQELEKSTSFTQHFRYSNSGIKQSTLTFLRQLPCLKQMNVLLTAGGGVGIFLDPDFKEASLELILRGIQEKSDPVWREFQFGSFHEMFEKGGWNSVFLFDRMSGIHLPQNSYQFAKELFAFILHRPVREKFGLSHSVKLENGVEMAFKKEIYIQCFKDVEKT